MIGEIWLDMAREFGHEPTGTEVHRVLEQRLKDRKLLGDLPRPRTTQDVLQHSKPALRARLRLDSPWSLGSLAENELPLDVLADVLEAWRISLAIGWAFTVREGQWVGRLRHTMPAVEVPESTTDTLSRMMMLYPWARIYALRERACEALELPIDTSDLDAELISMSAWEWHTAILVGAISTPALRWEHQRQVNDMEATIERESTHYFHMIGGWPHEHVEGELHLSGIDGGWVASQWESGQGQRTWKLITPSPEESLVYAYWLRYLSKGPKWDAIPTASPEQVTDLLRHVARSAIGDHLRFERQKQIAVRLREEIQAVYTNTQLYREGVKEGKLFPGFGESEKGWGDVMQDYPAPGYSIGPEPGPVPGTPPTEPHRQPSPPFFAWKPKDLLKDVGYDD